MSIYQWALLRVGSCLSVYYLIHNISIEGRYMSCAKQITVDSVSIIISMGVSNLIFHNLSNELYTKATWTSIDICCFGFHDLDWAILSAWIILLPSCACHSGYILKTPLVSKTQHLWQVHGVPKGITLFSRGNWTRILVSQFPWVKKQ